ncbi:hypothetical protein BaRGS_00007841 [Batillaria attramentaria]|uniref:Uncharacterized protein n=1 Tax=Batillaria attramentaria TaxID=370345 RepID=A0ABD0LNZ1_9CAEN
MAQRCTDNGVVRSIPERFGDLEIVPPCPCPCPRPNVVVKPPRLPVLSAEMCKLLSNFAELHHHREVRSLSLNLPVGWSRQQTTMSSCGPCLFCAAWRAVGMFVFTDDV